jgi:hypothetical protein
MKKQSKKPLVLTRETLRTLGSADLAAIVGGSSLKDTCGEVGSSVAYTCGCPMADSAKRGCTD